MEFELKIEEKVYKIPNSYNLGEWSKINQWKFKDPNDWPFLCAAALGIHNPAYLMEMKEEDPTQFSFLLSLVLSSVNIKMGAQRKKLVSGHTMLDLEEMNFGAFMDLDILASDGKSMDKLFARLYEMPLEEARVLELNDALPAITLYQSWRTSVYRAYSKLFDYDNNNQEEEESPERSRMTPAHAWYETLMVLCDGKFENIESAVQQPFRSALNFLAWKKTKMLEERMEVERTKQKMNR